MLGQQPYTKRKKEAQKRMKEFDYEEKTYKKQRTHGDKLYTASEIRIEQTLQITKENTEEKMCNAEEAIEANETITVNKIIIVPVDSSSISSSTKDSSMHSARREFKNTADTKKQRRGHK